MVYKGILEDWPCLLKNFSRVCSFLQFGVNAGLCSPEPEQQTNHTSTVLNRPHIFDAEQN